MKFLYRLIIFVLFFTLPIYTVLALIFFLLYGICGIIILMFVYLFTGKIYEMSDIFKKMIGAYVDVMSYCKEKSEC